MGEYIKLVVSRVRMIFRYIIEIRLTDFTTVSKIILWYAQSLIHQHFQKILPYYRLNIES